MSKKRLSSILAAGVMTLGFSAAPVGTVLAHNTEYQNDMYTYHTKLKELNGSDSSGYAHLSLHGNQLTVKLRTDSASPGVPHAQHLHIGGTNSCPDMSADKNNDGFIDTLEGHPSYGGIKVSLTTKGDVSPDSGLAVDRFPVANDYGTVDYERTFTLPDGVTENDLRHAVVVQHGISELFDDKAAYDGQARSSIDQSLPLEATIPSACGAVMPDEDQMRRDKNANYQDTYQKKDEGHNYNHGQQHGQSAHVPKEEPKKDHGHGYNEQQKAHKDNNGHKAYDKQKSHSDYNAQNNSKQSHSGYDSSKHKAGYQDAKKHDSASKKDHRNKYRNNDRHNNQEYRKTTFHGERYFDHGSWNGVKNRLSLY